MASKEVQPLASATGLPELVLKKAPSVPASIKQLPAEAPKQDVAEALAESSGVETSAAASEKTERSDESVEAEKKEKAESGETRDGNGAGDVDGDGKAA